MIANGVRWARSDLPERAVPTLLRYDTEDFFNGHGYTGPIEDHSADEFEPTVQRRRSGDDVTPL